MFKFLHIADVHLDTTFPIRSAAVRTHLRESLHTSFRKVVDCALDERVHAVLIAGDLFDNERLSFASERFLIEQCTRLQKANISCFYVTGDQDPGGYAFRAGKIPWPKNVILIADPKPRIIEMQNAKGAPLVRIVGAGHTSLQETSNLATRFPQAREGIPYIGLLHTSVATARAAALQPEVAPCSLEDLRKTSYSYWALGHIHERQQLDPEVPAWYPGNLLGRTPEEIGPRGGLLVKVRPGRPAEVQFKRFSPTQWFTIVLEDLQDVHTQRDLEDRILSAFDKEKRAYPEAEAWILTVSLVGTSPIAEILKDEALLREWEESLAESLAVVDVALDLRRLAPPVEVEAYRGEPHLLSELLMLIDMAGSDPDLLEELAPHPLAGSDESVDARRAYLHELLSDLDREAVVRLLKENRHAY